MSVITALIDFILHIDTHLVEIVSTYGVLTYVILAAIIFCETGLVVTPFLPGDSLLFAAGAISATGALNPWVVFVVIFIFAILGDAVNYAIGAHSGKQLLAMKRQIIKKEHVALTEQFFAKHGGKAIVYARFVPIVRTFAPFVAGLGNMPYHRFGFFNVAGALIWTTSLVGAGYFFGQTEIVRKNFSAFILGIIVLSIMPPLISATRAWLSARALRSSP